MKTLSLAVAVFACQLVNASTVQTLRINHIDTSITSQSYKLSEAEFLKIFGKNDSSKAFIKYFFYKRNQGKELLYYSPLPLIIAGGFSLIYFNQVPIEKKQHYGDFASAIFLFLAISTALALAINGTIRVMIFSRKKLLRRLNKYLDGKGLPKHITRSKVFMQFLTTGKVINRRSLPHHSLPHHKPANSY